MPDQHLPKYIGTWNLSRTISDGTQVTGRAVFARAGEAALNYHEDVRAILPTGKSIEGAQKYTVQITGEHLEMYFCNGVNAGKLFQRFLVSAAESSSVHQCVKDTYRSTWMWIAADHFRLVHDVKGPAKNYLMTTDYFKE